MQIYNYLGIDPGLATTGYSIIREKNRKYELLNSGIFTTSKDKNFSNRLLEISEFFINLIKEYNIKEASIEELFFSKNVKTGIKVAHARGVIINSLTRLNIPVFEYTPLMIKQTITSYGRADKVQVQNMVKILLNLKHPIKQDDEADACAVCLCHLSYKDSRLIVKRKV